MRKYCYNLDSLEGNSNRTLQHHFSVFSRCGDYCSISSDIQSIAGAELCFYLSICMFSESLGSKLEQSVLDEPGQRNRTLSMFPN